MKNYLFAVSSLLLLSLTACKDTGKEPSNITIDGASTEQPASTSTPATAEEATPAQNTTTPVASTPATTNQAAAASGKLNPAHGQPGHRCDIPVGTPLDAPAGGGIQASATPAPAPSSQGQPFLVNDQAKGRIMQEQGQTASSGKINPPHGQPGHRCDIQVGQPLP